VGGGGGELKRVRNFIFRLCNDFIDVALRTSYLVQIVRDKKYGSEDKGIDDGGERVRGERKLKSLVEGAVGIMQGEVEKLIRAVLGEKVEGEEVEGEEGGVRERRSSLAIMGDKAAAANSRKDRNGKNGGGDEVAVFDLGILDDEQGGKDTKVGRMEGKKVSIGRRRSSMLKKQMKKSKREAAEGGGMGANVRNMSYKAFTEEVLFEPGRTLPSVRHALALRRHVSRWCGVLSDILESLEWGGKAGEKAPFRCLSYIDEVVEHRLLPLLQADTVDGVVSSLEMRDAFKPPYTSRNTLQEVLMPDMTQACGILSDKCEPLFEALSRVPVDGEVYGAVLEVLEHSVLTFLSRAKARASELTNGTTALELIGGDINGGTKNPYDKELGRQGG